MEDYYILFKNHHTGLELYQILKRENIKATIAPTPRKLSACCGISLLIQKEDIDKIGSIIEQEKLDILSIESIKRENNANRDRYC